MGEGPASVGTAGGPGLSPSTPVGMLPGVGPARQRALARLELATVSDLLRHYPLRYERHFAEGAIDDLPPQGIGSARGMITVARWAPAGRSGRGRSRFEATLEDHSARLHLVWFNGQYLRNKLHPGMTLRVSGKVTYYQGYPRMANPQWEDLTATAGEGAARKDERLQPIYPSTEDLPSSVIEHVLARALPEVLPQVVDPLPPEVVQAHNMPALAAAFRMIHAPADEAEAAAARRRLAYNELLLLQLGIALKRQYNCTALEAPALRFSPAVDRHIRARFPFELTRAQDRAIADIVADLQKPVPMNRLVQGDVGSGKTVVALYAMLLAVANRRQGAIMTPTELLAEQHFASISRMLAGANVRLALLTSAVTGAERKGLLAAIAAGEIDIVAGTQALLTRTVCFHDLAVVVVDEQHRFGVLQRAAFRERAQAQPHAAPAVAADGAGGAGSPLPAQPAVSAVRQRSPHYLVMTATPIPRSLSLTVFGDLDLTLIDELPPGRTPIITRVVGQDKSDRVYGYLRQRVAAGDQAYVVVPTIDEAGQESAAQLKSLQTHTRLIRERYCPQTPVAAVHGRMPAAEREAVMGRFRAGEVRVLVATTVIEVGVDVPQARIMIVEHAERFGLAQLHQLRGRVGRAGDGQRSLCVLIADPRTPDAERRIQAIAETRDGFKIAEADLEIRGMGEFFGTRQHGLPPLKLARIPADMDLLRLAGQDARQIVADDPTLAEPRWRLLRQVLLQHHGAALGLVDVG